MMNKIFLVHRPGYKPMKIFSEDTMSKSDALFYGNDPALTVAQVRKDLIKVRGYPKDIIVEQSFYKEPDCQVMN